ncbi:MAG: hypothetical protein RIF36_09045 [Imperialibacter sp.]|uniref:hypothetical protein n=1 Tax=Imperialibacter sp. TaxID=2038411 RepID=UPI0032EECAED
METVLRVNEGLLGVFKNGEAIAATASILDESYLEILPKKGEGVVARFADDDYDAVVLEKRSVERNANSTTVNYTIKKYSN